LFQQIRGRKDVLSGSAKVQKDIGRTPVRNSDRFQICLAICRTSSSSVRHENIYKDPLAKHCYIPQRYRRNINSLNNNGDNLAVVDISSSVVVTYLSLSQILLLFIQFYNIICVDFIELMLSNYYLIVK